MGGLFVFKLGVWRCATLTWGNPTLPSPLTCFTSEFGMGSGGATSLWPPDKNFSCRISFHILRKEDLQYALWCVKSALLKNLTIRESLIFNLLSNLATLTLLSLSTTHADFAALGCMVKPLGQLVQVSLTPYNASTPCLSTS